MATEDQGKTTDAELLEQLAGAVSMKEVSPKYAVDAAYKLGVAEGRMQQARAAVETARAA